MIWVILWSYRPLLMSAWRVSFCWWWVFYCICLTEICSVNVYKSCELEILPYYNLWMECSVLNVCVCVCLCTSLTFRDILFFLCMTHFVTDALKCTVLFCVLCSAHAHVQPYMGDDEEQTGPLPPNPFSELGEKEIEDYRKRVERHHLALDGKTHSEICFAFQTHVSKLINKCHAWPLLSFKNSVSC